jgi:hypothetical protein
MLITRRSVVTIALTALATPALFRPALADTTYPDLNKGISFKRQDGSRGLARRESDGTVVIDYVTNRGSWIDKRHVVDGVFETYRELNDNEGDLVGSSPPEWFWKYSPKTLEPRAGGIWVGKVAEITDSITYGEEMKAYHNRRKTKWTAEYSFLESKDAKISGITYATVAVEANFSGESGTHSQRWIYFPKLYLGIETKRDGVANGITALTGV